MEDVEGECVGGWCYGVCQTGVWGDVEKVEVGA